MNPRPLVRALICAPLIAAALVAPAAAQAPSAAQAPPTERPAHGLIVKLKGMPPHESPQEVGATIGSGHRMRLQRVIADAGMTATEVRGLRPVGRSAMHLDFGRVLPATEAAQLAAKLAARSDVEWVVPNTRERRLATPSDQYFAPSFVGQWWLYTVSGTNSNALVNRLRGVPGFQTAWDRTTGSAAAVVAVLDTGVAAGHPDLDAHLLPGYDFITDAGYANDGNGRDSSAADPGDWVSAADISSDPARFSGCAIENSSWHGTDIAGLVAAVSNNTTGVAGINWNGRVLPVRVAGKCGADVLDIVDGMRWAAGLQTCRVYANGISGQCSEFAPINPNPARIINISFGGTGSCLPYQDTIDELRTLGVVVVAAAGNERGAITRPAKCPGAIGVGAVNRDGFKSNYSNFGPELTVTTVGGDPRSDGIWGPYLGDDGLLTLDIAGTTAPTGASYAYLFGTSFSAPLVSGTISLMLSANPALTATQIVDGLRRSARPHVTSPKIGVCSAQNVGRCICTTATCGAGLLDAEQAVVFALAPTTYVAPVRQAAVIDNAEVDAAVALGTDTVGASTPPDPVPISQGDDGGGALGAGWLLALALAVIAVARSTRGGISRRR